ncbi:hypothetical protein DDZ14_16115 [Maritimibacter sp. 55A14]|uniref:phage tail tube protein n=1 Tax=Maritimibacter sp. 55A14 TaxID=2174844 RepID=UPI000D61E7E9|nr:hypothetical protein [Maritimibacter sp. 55A14]PWE29966.1 hypothetical protein DDZ14_16115 [Maritimibacter sp. 55A14]
MIRWKEKVLLAVIESVYGVDEGPTGAANAILATNVSLTPMDGNDVSRELELAFLGAQATIPAELSAALNFSVELAPSGAAGTAPAWGPILRACGVAETLSAGVSVTYNPVSTGHESLTIHLWIGATRYVILGTRGTATLRWNAQGVPVIEFQMRGLFVQPAEQAPAVPTLTNFQKPALVSSANTPTFQIDGTALVMRNASLALGNAVEGRFLVGSESVLITDRADQIETSVEAVPLTTFNPFALAAAQTQVAVDLAHGVGAGKIATLAVPAAQMQRPQGLENQQNIKEWPLRLVPLPVTGNDQWTLTLT